MAAFPDSAALDYDRRIQTLIPGYSLALSLMGLKFLQIANAAQNCEKQMRILSVGCGTGSEILAIAPLLPNAHFYGVDPSKGMIDMAQKRITAANLAHRVTFIHGLIDDFDKGNFDAISLSLILHFIAQAEKKTFLQKLSNKLVAGGYFMMFDARLDENDDLLAMWLACHHDKNAVNSIMERIQTKWARLSQRDMENLFHETGFTKQSVFFQACCFHLSLAFKAIS
ncbi:class I SAM-dependent methyltransferase [Bartonella sp. HY761]|uniref:class I SAM-dependent methyltransferase n=1 Tax=Bartonella sp. HY761 TaxID=2979330 RepID=UPI0022092416|nr:class I SAM-dependent methyltransferase [Bartonella sp. HY761]UXN05736.1 class I SAM-dependent methyltransferase [Bartonella sp. HY761]